MTLELKGFFRYFPMVVFSFLFLIGVYGTIITFNNGPIFFKIFMLIWMGTLLYNSYKFVKMVIRIDVLNDGQIIFKTITGRDYKLFAKDFITIKIKNNVIEFDTHNGKFVSMGNFDGFSDFLVFIKKENCDLITKGC